jgi:hypothetical protein
MSETNETTNVKLPSFTCKRCGHTWHPRKEQVPVCCAACKSPYWNQDRPEKEEPKAEPAKGEPAKEEKDKKQAGKKNNP